MLRRTLVLLIQDSSMDPGFEIRFPTFQNACLIKEVLCGAVQVSDTTGDE